MATYTRYDVYCKGPLLDAVQRAKLFQDSKKFVDMPMKQDPAIILERFAALTKNNEHAPTKEELREFVKDNFKAAGEDLEPANPPDWSPSPRFLDKICDPKLRQWASDLNQLWKKLTRQIKHEVRQHIEKHSLICVPNPFIVPGERFREFYYWDTYWTVRGLLTCGMEETVRGMIENLLHTVKEYGFVPNGGRIYYTDRSQPPLLIPTVHEYFTATKDVDFLRNNIHLLETEYQFWMTRRSVDVQALDGSVYKLARYVAGGDTPRPEGYMEDIEVAAGLEAGPAARMYNELRSGAECGWDFSTRWFATAGPDKNKLVSIRTTKIVPVDLNAFMYLSETQLSTFHGILGNSDKKCFYAEKAERRRQGMESLMWDDTAGIWFDYDLSSNSKRELFYASNVVPLFTGMVTPDDVTIKEEKVLKYLKAQGVLDYPFGVPSSNQESGEQWDFPNAWAPSVHMLIEALDKSQSDAAKKEAKSLAEKWVESNWYSWNKHGVMYEKYDVTHKGHAGHGGEYNVQAGFGWTNSVIMCLLDKYPDMKLKMH